MPSKPKRPCSYPGCPNLTDKQYCPDHEAVVRRNYNKYERAPEVNKTYGRAWKRIRDRYVAAHPLCEMCQREGRLVPVEEVHHMISTITSWRLTRILPATSFRKRTSKNSMQPSAS